MHRLSSDLLKKNKRKKKKAWEHKCFGSELTVNISSHHVFILPFPKHLSFLAPSPPPLISEVSERALELAAFSLSPLCCGRSDVLPCPSARCWRDGAMCPGCRGRRWERSPRSFPGPGPAPAAEPQVLPSPARAAAGARGFPDALLRGFFNPRNRPGGRYPKFLHWWLATPGKEFLGLN